MSESVSHAAEISAEEHISKLQAENNALRDRIRRLELSSGPDTRHAEVNGHLQSAAGREWDGAAHGLTKDQIARYSRQIILPSFGVQAQAKLCRGSVLIIGAGGLGSPSALYLAAAGVGRIGIVDRDAVELSNIHRQVIHTEASVGVHKADSAAAALRALNSCVQVETHKEGFTPANALDIVRQYDVVLDASDNAPTRYLASDACAVARRPLVSGAAIGTDGQLTVYCAAEDGPCYRCLFPTAPAPQSCARCVDAGVLGVVPGIIGTMQALEAVKLLAGIGDPMSRRLLVVDSLAARFHVVKLRARLPSCAACGDQPEITAQTLPTYDYAAFTGQYPSDAAPPPLRLIEPEQRIEPEELKMRMSGGGLELLLDVRPPEQFAICHLPGAWNVPWKNFEHHLPDIKQRLTVLGREGADSDQPAVHVVCRRGNDSQRAVAKLCAEGILGAIDVVGGMEAWARDVDTLYPLY